MRDFFLGQGQAAFLHLQHQVKQYGLLQDFFSVVPRICRALFVKVWGPCVNFSMKDCTYLQLARKEVGISPCWLGLNIMLGKLEYTIGKIA